MESPHEEEKMAVYLKINRTVAFEVNRSGKIKDLKSLFRKKEGVQENLQVLFYNGQHLKDEEKLADHGIGSYSTLNLYVRGDSTKLFVKIPPDDKNAHHCEGKLKPEQPPPPTHSNLGFLVSVKHPSSSSSSMESPHEEEKMDVYLKMIRTVAFKVNGSSRIKDLKSLFWKKEGVEENLQELFYNGQLLKDEEKLADRGIRSYSTLNLYVRGDSTKLFVKIPPDDKNAHHRTIRDTMENIKYLIGGAKERIQTDLYALFYNAKQLEDKRTLASLNIPNESVLRMVLTPSDSLSVSVELPSGEVLKLEVKYLHRILDLKEIILSKGPLLASGQELSYEGKQLEDDKTVASYDIKPNSTLKVLPCTFQIFVKNVRSHLFSVKSTDTVLDLKKLILNQLGHPCDAYWLQCGGKPLDDKQNLATYGLSKNSTVHLYFRSQCVNHKVSDTIFSRVFGSFR